MDGAHSSQETDKKCIKYFSRNTKGERRVESYGHKWEENVKSTSSELTMWKWTGFKYLKILNRYLTHTNKI